MKLFDVEQTIDIQGNKSNDSQIFFTSDDWSENFDKCNIFTWFFDFLAAFVVLGVYHKLNIWQHHL